MQPEILTDGTPQAGFGQGLDRNAASSAAAPSPVAFPASARALRFSSATTASRRNHCPRRRHNHHSNTTTRKWGNFTSVCCAHVAGACAPPLQAKQKLYPQSHCTSRRCLQSYATFLRRQTPACRHCTAHVGKPTMLVQAWAGHRARLACSSTNARNRMRSYKPATRVHAVTTETIQINQHRRTEVLVLQKTPEGALGQQRVAAISRACRGKHCALAAYKRSLAVQAPARGTEGVAACQRVRQHHVLHAHVAHFSVAV